MKFKKIIKCSLAVALVFGTASFLTGCNKDDSSVKDTKQYEIYKMALDSGATDLSYEDWLVSIKGAKGDKGEDGHTPVITIGDNGNWYIDGDDTEVKATGADGSAGAAGTQWKTGTSAPTSTTAGENGDFYFDVLTQSIYRKENGNWVLKTIITDGIDGEDGREVLFQTTSSHIQWKYEGAADWTNLIPLSSLKGAEGEAGKQVELRVQGENIEWRYENGTWQVLTSLNSLKGAQGNPGEDGATWHTGTDNPSSTLGKEGDLYLETDTSNIWVRGETEWTVLTNIKGAAGQNGAAGSEGAAGEDGATWHTGTEDPTSTLGKEGDLYLETDTSNIWVRGETEWTVLTNIKGAAGQNGAAGTAGKDGTTWLTGVVNPDEAEGLNPKEGDFYFDKVANNIWTYTGGEWVLEVDLEDDVLPLTLEDDKEYTGSIMGKDFTFILETEENVQKVKELYINGVVDGEEQPINCKDMVISFEIENNVIVLTVDISNFPNVSEPTSTQYLVLDENDDSVLVTYVSDEDKELIKGTYESNYTHLTVGTSSILYWNGDARIRGTYQVVGHEDGYYTLNITTDSGKNLTANIDIYSRYYDFDIEDFSGEYSLVDERTFTYDSKTGTITFEGGEPIAANVFGYVEDSTKAAIIFEDDGYPCVYEVDYISGNVIDEDGFAGVIPFMGDAIMYGEYGPERFYVFNDRGNLERVYDNTVVYSNGAASVELNLNSLSYKITTNLGEYSYTASLESLYDSEPVDGVITIVDNTNTIKLAFNEDMTLNALNIIGEDVAIVTNEQALKEAIAKGTKTVSLADSIVLTSPVNVTNDVVIEGNYYTITASSELQALIESDLSEVYTLFYIAEDVDVEFNNITLDGNQSGRAITAINGHIVFNDTEVTNGLKKGVYRSGGVFIGYASSFEMNSGRIYNNNGSVAFEEVNAENYYLYHSSDLWIGANAIGSVVAINGGQVGKVFVNANAYSANNPGSFTLSGGYVDSVYVEYDSGYGATFNYIEGEHSHLGSLYISTTTSGVAADPIYNAEYGLYKGGEFAKDTWNGESLYVPQAVNNVINITKAGQLAGLAKSVNEGNTYEGITIKLDADLDLNDLEWTSIGYDTYSSMPDVINGAAFKGTFDGQNHIIYNLNVRGIERNSGGSLSAGLFGLSMGIVKNITIDGANVSSNHYAGVVVGFMSGENGSIDNVHVINAIVNCNYFDDEESGDKAGGVVGYVGKGSVTNSSVKDSDIIATRDAGQVIGCISERFGATQSGNSADNVDVSWDNMDADGKGNSNIKNEIVGRID